MFDRVLITLQIVATDRKFFEISDEKNRYVVHFWLRYDNSTSMFTIKIIFYGRKLMKFLSQLLLRKPWDGAWWTTAICYLFIWKAMSNE